MRVSDLFAATICTIVLVLVVSLASAQDSLLWMSRLGAVPGQAGAEDGQVSGMTIAFDLGGRPLFGDFAEFDAAAEPRHLSWQQKLVRGCMLGMRAVVDAIALAMSVTAQALTFVVGDVAPDQSQSATSLASSTSDSR